MEEYDVIIVGSGIVGLIHALLLTQKTTLRIAILAAKPPGPVWSAQNHDSRVYALTPASQHILQTLDLWQTLAAQRLSPFTKMSVWDVAGGGEVHFDHANFHVPALGFIVEDNLLHALLLAKAKEYAQLTFFYSQALNEIIEEHNGIRLLTEQGSFFTRLLIGADGANSWVREKSQLPVHSHDYQHSALITQVQTTEPHQQCARQCFLSRAHYPGGILAFLPLADPYQSAIVWSMLPEHAHDLAAMAETTFHHLLETAFQSRLGKIITSSQRSVFPLFERHLSAYVKPHLALIGDAAHTLHPLAGQGLNLGIADAAYLAEVIVTAVQQGRDFSSEIVLRRYQRARKANNWLMLKTVKFLKYLFTSESKSVQRLRSEGLRLSNQLSWLKHFFAYYAMGNHLP